MSAIAFDTLKYVEHLKAAGVNEQQAIAMSEAQKEIFSEAVDTQLASKIDIFQLKQDISALKQTVQSDISELKQTVQSDIAELKQTTQSDIAELKQTTQSDIAELQGRMTLLQWMLGATFAGVVAIVFMLLKLFTMLPS